MIQKKLIMYALVLLMMTFPIVLFSGCLGLNQSQPSPTPAPTKTPSSNHTPSPTPAPTEGIQVKLSLWSVDNILCIVQEITNETSVDFRQTECRVTVIVNGFRRSMTITCTDLITAHSTHEKEECYKIPFRVRSASIEATLKGVYEDGRTETVVANATL